MSVSSCDWSSLQQGLLEVILLLLPVADRCNAGLACKAWNAASDASNSCIELAEFSGCRLKALQQWLPRRGSNVTSLQLQLHSSDLTKHSVLEQLRQLPCSKLRALHLQGITVQSPLLPPTAPSTLTRLVLDSITLSQQGPLLADQSTQQQPEPWHLQQQQHAHLQKLLQELRGLSSLRQVELRGFPPSPDMMIYCMLIGQEVALQLPCEQLCDLELHGIRLHLPLLQVLQQPEQAANKLTKLVLNNVFPDNNDEGLLLQELGSLCSLQHLQLDLFFALVRILFDGASEDQLTVDLTPLSTLTQLQFLQLRLPAAPRLGLRCVSHGLQHLQSLAQLKLDDYCITQSDSSGIGKLTKLLALQSSCAAFDAAALGNITGLHLLQLSGCACPAAGLLQLLKQLTELTQLALTVGANHNPVVLVRGDMEDAFNFIASGDDWVDFDDGQDYQALSAAMLSSTHLQQLDLSAWVGMPGVTWQHMFTPAQQFRKLTSLVLPQFVGHWDSMEAADVQAMVRCCPALQRLHGCMVLSVQQPLGNLQQLTCLHAMQALTPADAGALADLTGLRELKLYLTDEPGSVRGEEVAPMLPLTHLTRLCLHAACDEDGEPVIDPQPLSASAADLLQRLVSLRHLDMQGASLSIRQLQGLTKLTSLTHLNFNLEPAEPGTSMQELFTNKAGSACPLDVAQQLHDACIRYYWQLEECLRKQLGEKEQLNNQLAHQCIQMLQHSDALAMRTQQVEQQMVQLQAANAAMQRQNAWLWQGIQLYHSTVEAHGSGQQLGRPLAGPAGAIATGNTAAGAAGVQPRPQVMPPGQAVLGQGVLPPHLRPQMQLVQQPPAQQQQGGAPWQAVAWQGLPQPQQQQQQQQQQPVPLGYGPYLPGSVLVQQAQQQQHGMLPGQNLPQPALVMPQHVIQQQQQALAVAWQVQQQHQQGQQQQGIATGPGVPLPHPQQLHLQLQQLILQHEQQQQVQVPAAAPEG